MKDKKRARNFHTRCYTTKGRLSQGSGGYKIPRGDMVPLDKLTEPKKIRLHGSSSSEEPHDPTKRLLTYGTSSGISIHTPAPFFLPYA